MYPTNLKGSSGMTAEQFLTATLGVSPTTTDDASTTDEAKIEVTQAVTSEGSLVQILPIEVVPITSVEVTAVVEKAKKRRKPRTNPHVPFATTTCPVAGCTSGKDGKPQVGSVPGIKRHVKMIHGEDAYKVVIFPPIR
jgi:hypothetical protein